MRKCRVVLYRRSINGWETGGQLFVRCWPHKPCPNEFRRRRQHICTRTLWKPLDYVWLLLYRELVYSGGWVPCLFCIRPFMHWAAAGWLAGWLGWLKPTKVSQVNVPSWPLWLCSSSPPRPGVNQRHIIAYRHLRELTENCVTKKQQEPTRTGQTGCRYLQKKKENKIRPPSTHST